MVFIALRMPSRVPDRHGLVKTSNPIQNKNCCKVFLEGCEAYKNFTEAILELQRVVSGKGEMREGSSKCWSLMYLCECVHACVRACVHACARVHACVRACVRACVCVCMSA